MTERQAALATLAHGDSDERVAALDIFYQRYRDNPLVLDKWFQVQAWSLRPDTVDAVKELAQHPDFARQPQSRPFALWRADGQSGGVPPGRRRRLSPDRRPRHRARPEKPKPPPA